MNFHKNIYETNAQIEFLNVEKGKTRMVEF